MSHKAKVPRTDSDGFELVRNLVTESQSKKIAEDQSDKILQKMDGAFPTGADAGVKDGFEHQDFGNLYGRRFRNWRNPEEI